MYMKNINVLIIFPLVIILACSPKSKEKLILTSNIAAKLIIQEITMDKIKCESLVPLNVSPHTFQPKPSDVKNLEKSLIFFYVSDLMEPWVSRKFTRGIALFSIIPEQFKLNFEDGVTADPHFWTDPLAVASIIDTLGIIISEADPQNSYFYQKNANLFKSRLFRIVREIDSLTKDIKGREVFLFHPSFRYYLRRFGLIYAGALEEVPGKEPTPAYLRHLINKIKSSATRVVFSEPQFNPNSAKILSELSGAKIFQLDPLGGNPETETYEKFIRYNTEIFIKAFKK